MRRVVLVIVVLMVIAGVNWLVWQSIQAPALPEITAPLPSDATVLTWDRFLTLQPTPEQRFVVPAELTARAGTRVVIDGVLFTMPQFIRDGKMSAAILTPPSRFGCCGLQCSSKPQLMMLCLFREPVSVPRERTTVARIVGTLHFTPDGDAWTMSELRDATVTWP